MGLGHKQVDLFSSVWRVMSRLTRGWPARHEYNFLFLFFLKKEMGLLGISWKHKNKTLTSFLFPSAPRRPLFFFHFFLLPPTGLARHSLSALRLLPTLQPLSRLSAAPPTSLSCLFAAPPTSLCHSLSLSLFSADVASGTADMLNVNLFLLLYLLIFGFICAVLLLIWERISHIMATSFIFCIVFVHFNFL
jgi:hypothetical protein